MGWAVGWDYRLRRDIGYGIPAVCDDPSCDEKINRGLAYCCGGEPFGGEEGCGLHFCGAHMMFGRERQVCARCRAGKEPYTPKPDTAEWIRHKLTDPSWGEWRQDNPDWVAAHASGIEAEGRNTEGGSVHESPTTVGRAPDPILPIPAPAGQGQRGGD